jgi:hypothetical protein
MSRHVWPARVLLAITIPLFASTAFAQIPITLGKYSKWALRSQFLHCHQSVCDGCVRSRFADNMNPFDDGDDENCNGIHEELNPYFWMTSRWTGDDWVSFAILTGRSTLTAAIDFCRQRSDQTNCTATVGSSTGNVPGAYLIGTEFELGALDRTYIDRFRTGPDPVPTADLENYVRYCWVVLHSFYPRGTAYWHYATHAAALYLADALLGWPASKLVDVQLTHTDMETAKRVFIHAFVAQQSWELGSWEYPGEVYVLDRAGIDRIPFLLERTPSFYYEIRAAIDHIFPVPVTNDSSTWGRMKALFETGGEQQ